jgi:hypothetical protein
MADFFDPYDHSADTHHHDPYGNDPHHPADDDTHHPPDPHHPDYAYDDSSWLTPFPDTGTAHDDLQAGSALETHYAHFNPHYVGPGIIGDPAHDMAPWHQQQHNDTCAVASQEFILDSFGLHLSEDALRHEALVHGWYTPNGGMPMNCVGDLLAAHGIATEQHEGSTWQDLVHALTQGDKVIVALNAEVIWYHGSPDDPLGSYPGIPGQNPDHAVEVIGMDMHDPLHPAVILNDPGLPDGRGIEVPESVFEQAWSASNHFMVLTTGPASSAHVSMGQSTASSPRLGDAQSDAEWANWNAKNAAYNADWARYNAQRTLNNGS